MKYNKYDVCYTILLDDDLNPYVSCNLSAPQKLSDL